MDKEKQANDSPNVIAPPPLIYLGGLLFGLILHFVKPLDFSQNEISLSLGVVLIVISVIVIAMSMRAFKKAGTEVDPRKPTTHFVAGGPYRFSRNPIYASMTLLYLGVTLCFSELWLLVILVPILLTIRYGVISREEAYLTEKFGEKYIQYKKSVRRWL